MTSIQSIATRCPSCGNTTLFLTDSGDLCCSWIPCRQPGLGTWIDQTKQALLELTAAHQATTDELAQARTDRDAAARFTEHYAQTEQERSRATLDRDHWKRQAGHIADAARVAERFYIAERHDLLQALLTIAQAELKGETDEGAWLRDTARAALRTMTNRAVGSATAAPPAALRQELLKIVNLFLVTPRQGAETDRPEGSRYITISDTLARELTASGYAALYAALTADTPAIEPPAPAAPAVKMDSVTAYREPVPTNEPAPPPPHPDSHNGLRLQIATLQSSLRAARAELQHQHDRRTRATADPGAQDVGLGTWLRRTYECWRHGHEVYWNAISDRTILPGKPYMGLPHCDRCGKRLAERMRICVDGAPTID